MGILNIANTAWFYLHLRDAHRSVNYSFISVNFENKFLRIYIRNAEIFFSLFSLSTINIHIHIQENNILKIN